MEEEGWGEKRGGKECGNDSLKTEIIYPATLIECYMNVLTHDKEDKGKSCKKSRVVKG